MNNILSFIIKLCLLFCLNLLFLNYKIYSECNNYCCKEKNKKNIKLTNFIWKNTQMNHSSNLLFFKGFLYDKK